MTDLEGRRGQVGSLGWFYALPLTRSSFTSVSSSLALPVTGRRTPMTGKDACPTVGNLAI